MIQRNLQNTGQIGGDIAIGGFDKDVAQRRDGSWIAGTARRKRQRQNPAERNLRAGLVELTRDRIH
ncbi:MAG: hypothetical protein WCJ07_04775, partial [Verrucomicrobiota bacterium]